MINGQVSFWMRDTAGSARDPAGAAHPERPPLDGDTTVDVCVVGAGYTGLWTAYWLRQALPDASILVVEARHVGYGASGRNGGWLSGKMIGLPGHLAGGPRGRQGVVDLRRAAVDSFDEILGIMADHDLLPGRPDARRPRRRPGHPLHQTALDGAPLPPLGAGATALAGLLRDVRPLPHRRPQRGDHPPRTHLGLRAAGRHGLRAALSPLCGVLCAAVGGHQQLRIHPRDRSIHCVYTHHV
ncbi:hypothetical protein GCM10010246_60680 [Streptomyces cuspidosporus]|uniref:FAD dependent oxidoreductase domain-containing protein n=1 Tax=Streptomyces cuspidosporus TaxID=66882 RepID=A0ABN3GUZ4_9ACTN